MILRGGLLYLMAQSDILLSLRFHRFVALKAIFLLIGLLVWILIWIVTRPKRQAS